MVHYVRLMLVKQIQKYVYECPFTQTLNACRPETGGTDQMIPNITTR